MSNLPSHVADHLRQVYFGGNWTCSNFTDQLEDVSLSEAIEQHAGLNSIAVLTYHSSYYVGVWRKFLEGGPFEAKDEWSFQLPELKSEGDWERLKSTAFDNARACADLIQKLPQEKMWETFIDEKYGNYLRNIMGMIEHLHYHLGQISLIKKLVRG